MFCLLCFCATICSVNKAEAKKAKARDSYIAHLTGKPDQPRFTIIRSGSWSNTPMPQSTTPGLHFVSIPQMAPPERTSDCSLLLIYRPRKDERLSWPSWLTCSGRFTHITGHSSDAGQAAQNRESSPAKDRRSLYRRGCIDHYARTVSEGSKDNTVSLAYDMIGAFVTV